MSSKEDEKGSSKYGEKEADEKIDFHHEGKGGLTNLSTNLPYGFNITLSPLPMLSLQ